MALRVNNNVGLPSLLKDGYKHFQGTEEAVYRNISACREMSEITKSSFGPNGMNKLVVNTLDKLFLTNDAGTILRELEVEHPAARLILMASQQQDKEIGDATNLVVILTGELLNNAEQLLRMGVSASIIVEGYQIAYNKTVEILNGLSIASLPDKAITAAALKPVIRTVLASKQHGLEDTLSELVTSAVMSVMPASGNVRQFNVDNIQCAKILGGSLSQCTVVRGMVFNREPESRIRRATKAKVAVYSCGLGISHTETKGTVLIHDAKEMLDFSKGEERIIESQIREIAESGVKVVISGESIGELALHFIDRYELLAVKVQSKFDLRRLCKAVGATPMVRLGAPTAEEAGFCDVVETTEIGSDRCVVFRQEQAESESRLATIVLRGSTHNQLDDLERAVVDAVNTVKAVSKDNRVLAGAGAAEIELAHRLNAFAETVPGVAQYAIKKFATAFEIVPRILAMNAGMDSTEVIAKLYWAHEHGSSATAGVDIDFVSATDAATEGSAKNADGKSGSAAAAAAPSSSAAIIDAAQLQIYDMVAAKASAIRLAVDAALTILRVDQIIMSKPAGGPKARGPAAQDEDD